MKEVMAIIRPERWPETKRQLLALGLSSFTVIPVLGRGRQKGLHYYGARARRPAVELLAKKLVLLWVSDDAVKWVVEAISDVNRTGQIGDGKIFISPLEDAIRISTGEAGLPAVG